IAGFPRTAFDTLPKYLPSQTARQTRITHAVYVWDPRTAARKTGVLPVNWTSHPASHTHSAAPPSVHRSFRNNREMFYLSLFCGKSHTLATTNPANPSDWKNPLLLIK